MRIKINGKEEEINNNITINNLIESKGLKPGAVVIEHNLDIVERKNFSNITLKENDSIEILNFVGGG